MKYDLYQFFFLSLISALLILSGCTFIKPSASKEEVSIPQQSSIQLPTPMQLPTQVLPGETSREAEQLYKQGIDYYDQNYYKLAAEKFQQAADLDYREAQFQLADMYYDGKGLSQDSALAAQWYRKAARQGHVEAQYNLGGLYRFGSGVLQNMEQATEWYRKAAEQGHVEAQLSLGILYYNGTEILQDKAEAKKWLSRAIEQGNTDAKAVYEKLLSRRRTKNDQPIDDQLMNDQPMNDQPVNN